MKFKVETWGIQIIPENAQDEVYLEHKLGLTDTDQEAVVTRENAIGLRCLAHATVRAKKNNRPADQENQQ